MGNLTTKELQGTLKVEFNTRLVTVDYNIDLTDKFRFQYKNQCKNVK
jgi:hypothetical protein